MSNPPSSNVLRAVDALEQDLFQLTQDLISDRTENPPGADYPACAARIANWLRSRGFETELVTPPEQPEKTNVFARRSGRSTRPCLHLNGHFDVVPAGPDWSTPPFGALVRDGRIYGRGSADMKGGLAAAMVAAVAAYEAVPDLYGSVTLSGTVDEESGGFAGVAHLTERGYLSADNTDYVIIPEPFGPQRICLGHRGVYWLRVTATGHEAHGSMPFLGRSAIDAVGALLEAIRTQLAPRLAHRETAMPVEPPEARRATINVNGISGGQDTSGEQTPCVADRATVVIDRRFLPEEDFEDVRREIPEILEELKRAESSWQFETEELMTVHPGRTEDDAPLVQSLTRSIREVTGEPVDLVASPGTYDQKHVQRIGGIAQCVAYGPGVLEQAHQPDEWVALSDLVSATKVMALTIVDLLAEP